MSNKTHTLETLLAQCVEEGECLMWQGRTTNHGVPISRFQGQHSGVRRTLWHLLGRRPLKPGQVVTTTCDNQLCCHPDHLLATTQGDLMRRRNRRGKGEAVRMARMTATIRAKAKIDMTKAEHIRTSSQTAAELASEMGLSVSMVNQIRRGTRWRSGSAMSALAALGAARR